MRKPKAFTLIELMIVIAIIALLMAIMVPAVERVKKNAKAVVCQSNLREWGIVWKLHADDHQGFFTPDLGHGKYAALARPELKVYYKNDKLLLCPMATKPYPPDGSGQNPFGAWRSPLLDDPLGRPPASYGINTWIVKNATAVGQIDRLMWKTLYVKKSASVPMVFDCAGYQNINPWHHDEPPEWNGHWVRGTSEHEMRYVCLDRHNERVNGVFFDLAVKPIALKQLWELKWHRSWYKGKGTVTDYTPPVWPEWMAHMKDYARK